jgi:hypothetical protein
MQATRVSGLEYQALKEAVGMVEDAAAGARRCNKLSSHWLQARSIPLLTTPRPRVVTDIAAAQGESRDLLA